LLPASYAEIHFIIIAERTMRAMSDATPAMRAAAADAADAMPLRCAMLLMILRR